MVPDCLLQRVGIDARPWAPRFPTGRERIRTGTLVVAMARSAVYSRKTETMNTQPAVAALQQAPQQVVVLLVAAKGHRGIAGQLGLGAIPGPLFDQRRHRDRDPLLGWTWVPAGPLSAATRPQTRFLGHHILVAVGIRGPGIDRIGQDMMDDGARPLRPARPGEPWSCVQSRDALADGLPAHEPSIDLAHHVGLGLVDDKPGGQGATSRLIPIAVRGLGAQDVPVACFLQLAPPEPLGQHRTLIFSDSPLDLQQELIVGVVRDGVMQERHLAVRATKLLEQQNLIGILARQPVRAEHRHDVDGGVADGIPQAVQPRPVQPGAAVALVAEHMGVGQGMTLGHNPGLQGSKLAMDGLLPLLALCRDPGIDGNAHGSSPRFADWVRRCRARAL